MRAETIAESFATYRARVIPADAPAVQVEECRRAFYAGVYFLLLNLMHNLGDDSTSEEQGIVELEKLKAECEAFAAGAGMPLPTATAPLIVEPSAYNSPHDEEMRPVLQQLGHQIAGQLPEGWGFNLLLFTYGAGGSLLYIASAERSDVIKAMREFIKRNTQ